MKSIKICPNNSAIFVYRSRQFLFYPRCWYIFQLYTEHKNETERIFRLSFIFVKIWIKFLNMVNCFFCYVSHCVCVNAKLRQN